MTRRVVARQLLLIATGLCFTDFARAVPQGNSESVDAPQSLCERLATVYGVEEIVFAERAHNGRGKVGDGHWYANFGYYADNEHLLT